MRDVAIAIAGVGAFLGGVLLLTRTARASVYEEPMVVVPTCDDLAPRAVVVVDAPGAKAGCGCSSCSCGR